MEENTASAIMAVAARSMGLDVEPVGEDRILWIRSGKQTLGFLGNRMSCNSIMVDRLTLIPPYHLALLKHEGLPVTLVGSLDARESTSGLLDAVSENECIAIWVWRRRTRWSFFAETDGIAGLRRGIDAAWQSGAQRVDLLRMPTWRRFRVLAVHGAVISALEQDGKSGSGAAPGPTATRRVERDELNAADWQPLVLAARIVGLAIGTFDVLWGDGGRMLIAGYSCHVPWQRFCGSGASFDQTVASDTLALYFRSTDRAADCASP